jgi:hypothetical protein
MAKITWTGHAGDNNWNNAANWSPAQVPGPSDTVTISTSVATDINVSNEAVGALTTNSHVTLTVGSAEFTLGTAAGGATIFSNGGTFLLAPPDDGADLVIGAPTLTLKGGGTVALGGNNNNFIVGAAATDVLDNVNNTITGAGQIGNGGLSFINGAAGVVDASTAGNELTLNNGTLGATNAGLLEATGGGELVLQTVVADGARGRISAQGGTVYLNGATVEGGTLSCGGGGVFVEYGAATLSGVANAITNTGTVEIPQISTLSLLGSIVNSGAILLQSQNDGTFLDIGPTGTAGTVMLTGAGAVTLSNNGNNFINASFAGDTLVNVNNVISGAGQIGGGTLTVVNEAAGIIDANQTTGLTLATSGGAVTNAGLIEATGAGGLEIVQTTVNDSSGGTLLAAGGDIYLDNAEITGGVIDSSGGGDVVTSIGTLSGASDVLTSLGTVMVQQNGALYVVGTIANAGTIALESANDTTDLFIGVSGGKAGTVTLTGHGQVTLSDNANNYISGGLAGETLLNLNNTISGGGTLGGDGLAIVNDATIDANAADSALTIDSTATLSNTGLLESTSTGGLVIDSIVNDNSGGTLAAAGGDVYLHGGTIEGGTITSAGGAAVIASGGATLNGAGAKLANLGMIVVQDNNVLNVQGSIANQGVINLASTNDGTDLIIDSAKVVLSGTGTLLLSDDSSNYIYGAAASDILDNAGNLIEGAGQLGNGQLTLLNDGIISATGATALTISLGSTGTNEAGGQLLAAGAGGLSITNGAYTNLGLIQAEDGSSVTFSSTAVLTNSANGTLTGGAYGAVSTGNDATLTVSGGTIVTDAADIILSGAGSTISFGGTTVDDTLDVIAKTGTLAVLGERDFNVIADKGMFTDDGTLLLGGGTFKTASITVGAGALASGSGTLTGPVTLDGTVGATGGKLVVTGALSDTSHGTLTGGGVSAAAASTLTLVGNAIAVDAGEITLAGVGSAIIFGTTAIDKSLNMIAANGTLAVDSGRVFDATSQSGKFTDDGLLSLGGGTFESKVLTIAAGARVSGFGTIASAISNHATITASGGTLVLTRALTAAGALAAASGATLELSAGGTLTAPVSGGGTLGLGGATTFAAGASLALARVDETANATLAQGVSLTNAASHDFNVAAGTGAALTLGGASGDRFTNDGSFAATGAGTETVSLAFVNAGLASASAGTLSFAGAVTNSGTISAIGGTVDIATSVAGTGTLDVGAGGTLALALGAGAGQTADFTASTGLLDLSHALDFAGAIGGFAGIDTIELANTTETSFGFSGGVLTVKDGGTIVASLHFTGSYTQSEFGVTNDTHGNVVITFI